MKSLSEHNHKDVHNWTILLISFRSTDLYYSAILYLGLNDRNVSPQMYGLLPINHVQAPPECWLTEIECENVKNRNNVLWSYFKTEKKYLPIYIKP